MTSEYKLCDKCGENETARVIDGEYVCATCFLKSHGIEPGTAPSPTPTAKEPVKEMPAVIPKGMFWCSHCNSLHRTASKVGQRHLKYAVEA